MSRPSIQLEDRIAEPYFCEDRGDFYKLCLANCHAFTDDMEDSEYFAFFIRLVCHEYLALVLSKKIEPYEMSKEVVEHEMPGFKQMLGLMNEVIVGAGVPTYESDDGKIKIDYDEMDKIMGKEDNC